MPTELMIILGSGGHTTEMFYMLEDINLADYTHRSYVVSSGDSFSSIKADEFERRQKEYREQKIVQGTAQSRQLSTVSSNKSTFTNTNGSEEYSINIVPRARHVHEPLLTTPFSAFQCLIACLYLLNPKTNNRRKYPDLILTNGPGTAVMIIVAALLLRFFNLYGANKLDCMRIVYVESWARIRTLSLSGHLLLPLVDRFIVQWKGLETMGRRCEFHGPLVLGGRCPPKHLKTTR